MLFEVAKVLHKFQVTLPKEIRDILKLDIGDRIVFIETPEGILLRRVDAQVVQTIIDEGGQ